MLVNKTRGLIFLPALAMAFFLGGCAAVGPDYVAPKPEMPSAWQEIEDPAVKPGEAQIRTWWTVFDDPLLTSLIERAAKGNLDLMTAMARVKQARAQLGVATGEMLPTLDASGSATRQRGSEYDIAPGGVTQDRLLGQLDASWEIDLFGRIRRSIEAAKADYQATTEDRNDVMLTLYADVARTYFAARTAQARFYTAQENIRSQKKVLKLTKTRLDTGLATSLDVAQAESVLASSEAELPPFKIDYYQSVHALALLLGKQPGALKAELKAFKPIPKLPAEVKLGMPADLLRRRPDIRQAERSLAAETARIGVATADLYPSFTITGAFGVAATDAGDLFKSGSGLYSFGPAFSWNLFQGDRIRAQIRAQDAVTEQALYTYEQTVLKALGEVEDALTSYVQARIRVEALKRTVQASRRTLELSVGLYKDGLKDFQSVLDAQRSLFSYANEYAAAQGDTAANLVQLYKALGGGWQPVDSEPKKKEETEQKAQDGKAGGKSAS
ncbi:efflux transporter outer membrane subunit [Dethiosulfatarculus sandiegensis]|uniref:RND transporter n=1 Tax=Dethiosulfatarculus sandiegensis TaxID=1429043 RepID=A0A0D2HY61_9BACT|nr:efflux transporter outer membrane subunit [Dethiosulfatarculus sandiegensis]KIX15253.1 RND transporter [Dethiosulfatarculus sandiegensis]